MSAHALLQQAPQPLPAHWARLPRMALDVVRVGYLVPACDFDGIVHSVFGRACNISRGGSLLTLVAPTLDEGPTTMRLACGMLADLRTLFRAGEPIRFRDGRGRSSGAVLQVNDAAVWRPAPRRPLVADAQIRRNVRHTRAALARLGHRFSSVLDREAASVSAALEAACARLDAARAAICVERLIGWGEGLTPAGDDFLVGWCAASDALAGGDGRRVGFVRDVRRAIAARAARTTPIAAHALRLAAQGHFSAHVHAVCDAVLGDHDEAGLECALDRAFGVGATSGADMVKGVLSGCSPWLHPWLNP